MNKFRPLLTPEVMQKTAIVFALDFGDLGKWTFDMKTKGIVYHFFISSLGIQR